jgi:hypothetical protein
MVSIPMVTSATKIRAPATALSPVFTAGCVDTDLSVGRCNYARSDESVGEAACLHHAMWVDHTETCCKSVFCRVEGSDGFVRSLARERSPLPTSPAKISLIVTLLATSSGLRPLMHSLREILKAICYIVRSGCGWRPSNAAAFCLLLIGNL